MLFFEGGAEEGNFKKKRRSRRRTIRARKGTRKPNLRKDLDQQDLGPGLGPAQAPFGWVGVRVRRL